MGAVPALEAAFALARMPTLAPHMRNGPVPAGVSVLLRIVAGEEGLASSTALNHGVGETDVRHAAEFYIQQVMLFPGAAPHRVLGLEPGATREVARAHMRRLLLWLHPDRSDEEWRAAFAGRVLEAWRGLSLEPSVTNAGQAPPSPSHSAPPVVFSPRPGRSSHRPSKRRPLSHRRPKLIWIPIPLPKEAARRSRGRLYLLGSLVFIIVSLTPDDGPRNLFSAFHSTADSVVEPELRASVGEEDDAAEPSRGDRAADPFGTLR